MSKKGNIICCTSCKGGVGKTTTVLNMAGIYESMAKRVLIIDLDLSNGGIAISLNKPYSKDLFTLFVDLQFNLYKEFDNYITSYDKYIDILPCSIDPRNANKIDNSLIDIILERAAFLYDVVLIDTTHVISDLNLYAMDKSDKILFITTNDAVDLKNLKSMLTIYKDLNINKYKIMLNNSLRPYKGYFSIYDMKSILGCNIDYSLSKDFFVSNIDNFVMNGNIITLEKRVSKVYSKDYAALVNMCCDLLSKGDKNE